MEVQFKLQVRDFVEWDVQRYHRPQKATVVDPYPSPPTASSRLRAAQYCRLIIPHVILGVLRHGSSPRQPRLGWYDHRLYRQEVYLETSQAFSNVSSFIQATVRSFRAGSVIATVDIKFQNTSLAPSSDVAVLATLQQYISDNEGRLGNLSVSQVDVATVNHCQPDPCVYGTCISGPDNYICTCDEGYEGETCNIYI
ncbi:hypothetical protein Bbelb_291100, partial [Branchiostoma belcheri]